MRSRRLRPPLLMMRRIVDKSFVIKAPVEVVWNHLAQIEAWPSWARHIRSVEQTPKGQLCAQTQATMWLTNGIRSTFIMTEFDVMHHWKWRGTFLGCEIDYDHVFQPGHQRETIVRLTVDMSGGPTFLVAGVFGRIYVGNLDGAIPLLVKEIETRVRTR